MIWPKYLHHITIHFPIVLLMVMAALGLWSLRHDIQPMQKAVHIGGWAAFALTSVAIITGLLTAPGTLGFGGDANLDHHRNLALTTWAITGLGAWSYHKGIQDTERDWRMFGVMMWCVAAFAVLGAGHWGGASHNKEIVPWYDQTTKTAPKK